MINAPEPRFLTYQSAGKTVKRPILDEGEPGFRSTFESIPVISFKHINSSSLSERQELAKEVGKACR